LNNNNPNLNPNLNYVSNDRMFSNTFNNNSFNANVNSVDQLTQQIEYLQRMRQLMGGVQGTMPVNVPLDAREAGSPDIRYFFQKILGVLSIQNTVMQNLKVKSVEHSNDLREITSELKRIR
jgi:hypothetical protein